MYKIFHESRYKIVNILVQVENIESTTRDPASYINQHFDLNKKHISWRRIDLKAEIDLYCDQLLAENESNRSQCLQLANEANQISNKIKETKEELCSLKRQFETFDSSVTKLKCQLGQMNANYLLEKFRIMHEKYKEALLVRKELLFVFFDRPVEDIVGKVIDKRRVNWFIF
jgi:chromosome segregation ATPase